MSTTLAFVDCPDAAPTTSNSPLPPTSLEGLEVALPPSPFETEEPKTDTNGEPHDENEEKGDDDAPSTCSDDKYEQEPWETFQTKVLQLALELFPDSRKTQVSHMKGGGFNRVAGITVTLPGPKKYTWEWFCRSCKFVFGTCPRHDTEEYVLRIPRHDDSTLEFDIATFKLVESRLSLPTPVVTHSDLSEDNAIGSQYMVQRRLHGQNLYDLWDSLNLEQKKSVARQVTRLVSEIAEVTSEAAGRPARTWAPGMPFELEKFEIPRPGLADKTHTGHPGPGPESASKQTPLEYFLDQCRRWHKYNIDAQEVDIEKNRLSDLAGVARRLDFLGFFEPDTFHLCHCDLQPYNMLVEVRDEETVEITGILDWDSALFAPSFVAYRAPFWLWYPDDAPSDERFDYEDNANIEPQTEAEHELKKVFMETASPEFLKHAFSPEILITRDIFHLLKRGLYDDWDTFVAESSVEKFRELHPELYADEDEESDSDSDDSDSGEAGKCDSDEDSDMEDDMDVSS
jgi:hypothetical protein